MASHFKGTESHRAICTLAALESQFRSLNSLVAFILDQHWRPTSDNFVVESILPKRMRNGLWTMSLRIFLMRPREDRALFKA
mmetsp:Transcript_2934/g.7505  ORF Transcript_2934/g.7505 Transcript_2934/m.7505 type:complete len:82 (-) Transcript_2934:57-302(-)